MSTNCVCVRRMLPEFAEGALSGAERARVMEHVDACAACREALADVTFAIGRLTALPVQEVGDACFPEALEGVGCARGAVSPARPARVLHLPRRRVLAVAAAAGFLLAVGVWWLAASPRPDGALGLLPGVESKAGGPGGTLVVLHAAEGCAFAVGDSFTLHRGGRRIGRGAVVAVYDTGAVYADAWTEPNEELRSGDEVRRVP